MKISFWPCVLNQSGSERDAASCLMNSAETRRLYAKQPISGPVSAPKVRRSPPHLGLLDVRHCAADRRLHCATERDDERRAKRGGRKES